MTMTEAIKLIRPLVKESAVEGQNHIDFLLVSADRKPQLEEAMRVIHKAIFEGELTQEEFETKIGLI